MKRHSCVPLRGFCLPREELMPSRKQLPPVCFVSFTLGKAQPENDRFANTAAIQNKMMGEKRVATGDGSNVCSQQALRSDIYQNAGTQKYLSSEISHIRCPFKKSNKMLQKRKYVMTQDSVTYLTLVLLIILFPGCIQSALECF